MDPIDTFATYLSACYERTVPHVRLDASSSSELRLRLESAPALIASRPAGAGDTPGDFANALCSAGLHVEFSGWSPGCRLVAVAQREPNFWGLGPSDFTVLAFVPTYNEADVIAHTLQALIGDGIHVYIVDNWSTDATFDIAQTFLGRGVIGIERFPATGPSDTYDLRSILCRVEELASTYDADWYVLHDADERRRPPWPELSLRDALFTVGRLGFNCIDHVTLTFWPVDNGYTSTDELERYFQYFEWSRHPGHFHQRRVWKNTHQRVSLAATAGHDVSFPGRRVCPWKFLLKHYPIRSQAHGERKVLHERQARFDPRERSLGWHAQYDDLSARKFVRDARALERFDATFYERRLIERLSGVGVFDAPPEWATTPHWALPCFALRAS